jgi:SAM-dependent methyltransferase
MADSAYVLGHAPGEVRRLIDQAAILRPITERLLRRAGIKPGMRVLDIGCGAGDVSLLAGDLVGTTGTVVGIDRNPDVLAVAQGRAFAARLPHVVFTTASVDGFTPPAPFDFVVARYVLTYQDDPAAFLARAARFVAPGGILALHELRQDLRILAMPSFALWETCIDLVCATFRARTPHPDAAGRLVELFAAAHLPPPMLFAELPVGGGPDAALYPWLAGVVRSLLPVMIELGLTTAEAIAIETLEERLRAAGIAAHSQIEGPRQVCAWVTL